MISPSAPPPGSWFAPAPYVLTGLAPYAAGALLAVISGFPGRPAVFFFGLVGVSALIKGAFAARGAFAPDEGRCPTFPLPPAESRRLAYACLAVAALAGVVLQFWMRTGDLTIPLGGLGVLGGYFYFAPPLQWGRRGCGEAVGALCFGLLPVATGLYLQCGHLLTEVLLYGLPLSFAAFNLFLIQGFPEPGGEARASRFGLASRLRPVAAAMVYTIFNVLTILGLVFILWFPAPALPWRNGLWLFLALAVVNQELVKRKAYLDAGRLRLLGRLTLALHLGLGLMFVLMLWQRA